MKWSQQAKIPLTSVLARTRGKLQYQINKLQFQSPKPIWSCICSAHFLLCVQLPRLGCIFRSYKYEFKLLTDVLILDRSLRTVWNLGVVDVGILKIWQNFHSSNPWPDFFWKLFMPRFWYPFSWCTKALVRRDDHILYETTFLNHYQV